MNHSAPPILGFGISSTEHVRKAILSGSEGVICGSAIVKIIEPNLNSHDVMLSNISSFIKEMKDATKDVI